MNQKQTASVTRFGIVGCGRIAQSHLDALATLPETKVNGIVEIRPDAGEAVAERFRCPLFQTYDDPEFNDRIDMAIICTPPNTHFTIAKHLLSQKVPVLCEKPLTISSDEARKLVSIAEQHDTLMMMASKFRYVDDVIKARGIVESGILGEIVLYENTFCGKVTMDDRWNSDKKIAGGGVLIDNGSHSVDIARYLLGPIREVQAQRGVPAQKLEVEDTVRLQFKTHKGVIGMVDLSWSINKEMDSYISLFGTEGTLHVGWAGSKYRQDGSSRWIPFGAGYDKVKAFRSQLENFIAAARGQQMPLITTRDALASVRVIEAAYASSEQNHWHPVER